MNVTLWIISGVLAALFLAAGAMKLTTPKDKLLENPQMGWAVDFTPGALKFIGTTEVLGALGLILPGLLGIATWLVPLAAVGLGVLMAGAAYTHFRRGETQSVVLNVVLLLAAAFVAFERFGSHAL